MCVQGLIVCMCDPWGHRGLIDHNLCVVCVCVCVCVCYEHKHWMLFELVHLGPGSQPVPVASSGVPWMWFIPKQGDPNEDEAGATATVWRGGGRGSERDGGRGKQSQNIVNSKGSRSVSAWAESKLIVLFSGNCTAWNDADRCVWNEQREVFGFRDGVKWR